MSSATLAGSIHRPAPSGSRPATSWSHCELRNETPAMTMPPTSMTASAVEKARLRKRVRSTSGLAMRRWRRRKTTPIARPTAAVSGRDRRVAAAGDLLEAVDDRQDRGEREHRAGEVDVRAGVPLGLRQHPAADDDEQDHERHAEQEGRAPPEVLEQDAADERADGHAAHEAASTRRRSRSSSTARREDRADEAHRRRHQGGAGDAEHGPPEDELLRARRVGGARARDAEGDRADEQEAACGRCGRRPRPSSRGSRRARTSRCRASTAAGSCWRRGRRTARAARGRAR